MLTQTLIYSAYIQALTDDNPVHSFLFLTVLEKSFRYLGYFIADALTCNNSAGSDLQICCPEGLTDGSVPACKWAWVALPCHLCKQHTVLLQSFSVFQAPRVTLKGPEIA